MTTNSVMQLVRFQRSIGALPKTGSFSVRGNWGHQIAAVGGLRKYVASYKGVVTYLTVVGVAGPIANMSMPAGLIVGVLTDLLNGAPGTPPSRHDMSTSGPSQSYFWNQYISVLLKALQKQLKNTSVSLQLDWFSLTSPSGNAVNNAKTALQCVANLLLELNTRNSATAQGQFELDIQNAVNPQPVWVA